MFSVPALYRLGQRGIGSANVRRVLVEEYLQPRPSDRVLDIGCGTGDLSPLLVGCDYIGYDLSERYVAAARSRYGDFGEFRTGSIGDVDLGDRRFDRAVAKGVLHHLDDEEARELFRSAHRVLMPGGRLATIDPAYVQGQGTLARSVIDRDRGQNVRSPEEYEALARSVFPNVSVAVRHDLLNVPYTHAILTCRGE